MRGKRNQRSAARLAGNQWLDQPPNFLYLCDHRGRKARCLHDNSKGDWGDTCADCIDGRPARLSVVENDEIGSSQAISRTARGVRDGNRKLDQPRMHFETRLLCGKPNCECRQ